MSVSAKVICDSQFNFTRLITLEIELHRFILPEFNTHRSFSRNFQSSRAVPVKQMIEQVRSNPALPVHWGKNKPGMQANEELEGKELKAVVREWHTASGSAVYHAEHMVRQGVHKQIVNRILEPFMWTKGVVTATKEAWEEFFELRCHKDAQPEIQALAFKIRESIRESEPVVLKQGQWHLPYVRTEVDFVGKSYYTTSQEEVVPCSEVLSLEEAIKVSTSCTGQVSYRKLDDSLEKALKIYDMLNLPEYGIYKEDPPHFSPTEHVAQAKEMDNIEMSGNFHSKDFVQYRKILERGLENNSIQ